jgi:hypothetical protein
VCDDDATSELRVKTVRYFKGIQETQEALLHRPMDGYSGTALAGAGRGTSPVLGPTGSTPSAIFASTVHLGAASGSTTTPPGGGKHAPAGSGVDVTNGGK